MPFRMSTALDALPMPKDFQNDLDVTPMPDAKRWRVNRGFTYVANDGQEIHVPTGFITDFASIPDLVPVGAILMLCGALLLWWHPWAWLITAAWIVEVVGFILVWLSDRLRPWGIYGKAAVIHDWIYRTQLYVRGYADRILREAMLCLQTPRWQIYLIYFFVWLLGWWAYTHEPEDPLCGLPKV